MLAWQEQGFDEVFAGERIQALVALVASDSAGVKDVRVQARLQVPADHAAALSAVAAGKPGPVTCAAAGVPDEDPLAALPLRATTVGPLTGIIRNAAPSRTFSAVPLPLDQPAATIPAGHCVVVPLSFTALAPGAACLELDAQCLTDINQPLSARAEVRLNVKSPWDIGASVVAAAHPDQTVRLPGAGDGDVVADDASMAVDAVVQVHVASRLPRPATLLGIAFEPVAGVLARPDEDTARVRAQDITTWDADSVLKAAPVIAPQNSRTFIWHARRELSAPLDTTLGRVVLRWACATGGGDIAGPLITAETAWPRIVAIRAPAVLSVTPNSRAAVRVRVANAMTGLESMQRMQAVRQPQACPSCIPAVRNAQAWCRAVLPARAEPGEYAAPQLARAQRVYAAKCPEALQDAGVPAGSGTSSGTPVLPRHMAKASGMGFVVQLHVPDEHQDSLVPTGCEQVRTRHLLPGESEEVTLELGVCSQPSGTLPVTVRVYAAGHEFEEPVVDARAQVGSADVQVEVE